MTSGVDVPKLRIQGLSKRYGNGVLANDDISLHVADSTIHAIVGENGAGKSTVMKVLYGLEQADAGRIELDGRPVRFLRPADAIAAGVGLVPQHLKLVPSMSVLENIVLGSEPTKAGWLDGKEARRQLLELEDQYGLSIDPDARICDLSAGAQQRVEILKTLRRGARLLLLDEPTALLTPQETAALFKSLRSLVEAQLTVVLITHKMSEVREVCEDFTVMRAARVVGRGRSADCSEHQIAEMIVGRSLAASRVKRVDARDRTALVKVRCLSLLNGSSRPELCNINLDVAQGEIVGIAGVEGNGQNRLADVLSGICAPTVGSAQIDGQDFVCTEVRVTRSRGVGCIPEDRLHSGVAPSMSIAENAAALDYFAPPHSHFGVLDEVRMSQRAAEVIARYRVRAKDASVAISTLSGGNMQKVVVGRELDAKPRFLVAAQPTRGVDIGAAQTLRDAIVQLRDEGAAVLLISADLDEVFEMSDRIAVLFEGRIVAHFKADQVSQEEVGRYMTGLVAGARAHAQLDAEFTEASGTTDLEEGGAQ